MNAVQAKYRGFTTCLQGKTALVIADESEPDVVLAQFDDLTLPPFYTFGWKMYAADDFVIPSNSGANECTPTSTPDPTK